MQYLLYFIYPKIFDFLKNLFFSSKEGFPITEPNYYAHITEQELKHILRSDTAVQIPLFDSRLKILRETGKILLEVNIFNFRKSIKVKCIFNFNSLLVLKLDYHLTSTC